MIAIVEVVVNPWFDEVVTVAISVLLPPVVLVPRTMEAMGTGLVPTDETV